ncbi:MAG TPA: ATP-binding protein [Bryobacteraceae bacterium]|nr:ATP-binding protein [Bryobacteraceae bacterium]
MTEQASRHSPALSTLQRYGLSVLSVSVAIGLAVLLNHSHVRNMEVPLLLMAVAISAWYGGGRPAIVALVLSTVGFNYFFVEPVYTLYIAPSELPYFMVFFAFASLVTWFSAVRRRMEEDLRQARDKLQVEVAERTRQANLLDLTHDSIFVTDLRRVITYWNLGAQELYGWTAEQAAGRISYELLATVFPESMDKTLEELARTGRWDGELTRTRANGTSVVVASRFSVQRDQQGKPIAILETSNDITERKHREEQIQGLNQELARRSADLEASNKELEAFAYSISHDLRAPLRHMAGFTELLQKSTASVLNEKSLRYVATIREAAQRMGTLIDDLLAFSRIGRAETHKSVLSLEQVVREAISEVKPESNGRNIAWKIGGLPSWYGDHSMLRLVLVNLIANSVKFTRPRPAPEIEIGCRERDQNQVVLFIRDNGVGFDMKYANKLFGVFQRLHSADQFEGTGIGLATVQRIVHRHGGRVWAESAVDQGATFYFSLSKPQGVTV